MFGFLTFWSVHESKMFCMRILSHNTVTDLRRKLSILVKLSSFRPARAFFRVPLRLSSMITATVTSGLWVRPHVCVNVHKHILMSSSEQSYQTWNVLYPHRCAFTCRAVSSALDTSKLFSCLSYFCRCSFTGLLTRKSS